MGNGDADDNQHGPTEPLLSPDDEGWEDRKTYMTSKGLSVTIQPPLFERSKLAEDRSPGPDCTGCISQAPFERGVPNADECGRPDD